MPRTPAIALFYVRTQGPFSQRLGPGKPIYGRTLGLYKFTHILAPMHDLPAPRPPRASAPPRLRAGALARWTTSK
jgi:hypothetical protein